MSRYSWWSGSKVSCASKVEDKSESSDQKSENHGVALIIGLTGIVGNSLAEILPLSNTPGGPWKVYGVARRPKPDWSSENPVQYIQCDVLNREQTLEMISPLNDVTHLFWVTWARRETEELNCEDNGRMFNNVLDALLPGAENLKHICLQTGGKQYIPLAKNGNFQPHEPPYHEELPRLPGPNFYHTLEDILFETAKNKKGLTWSIHRPTIIFGFSPWSLMNVVGTLCVYAAVCKYEGLPFIFPGNKIAWDQFQDVADAQLVAEQEIWAATDPYAKNQPFNVANGDVFRWKQIWRLMAKNFELELLPFEEEGFSLSEAMRDKGPVWDAIVKANELHPTKIDEVGSWWFADTVLNVPTSAIHSINKSKEYGFFGFRNTETSFLKWVDKMKTSKIIP